MSIDVKFAYVCRFKFTDLPGNSDSVRHCNQCDLDVTNLDAMDDDTAVRFLQEASSRRRRVCVSATVQLPDADQCLGSQRPRMATAGAVAPEPISLIDVFAPEKITADQYALLMKILKLPNRLSVALLLKEKQSIRLGPYSKWKLREQLFDPLDKVGLKWAMTEVRFGDEGYWGFNAKSIC